MAKKLMLGYGEYRANWEYDGKTHSGAMSLQPGRGPEGELDDVWTGTGDDVLRGGRSVRVGQLGGTLTSNHEVVLLDVRINHWWPGRASLAATYGLVGVGAGVPDDLQFTSVEFQVGGLTELSGVQPFKDLVLPQPDALQADFVTSATWSAEAAAQTWIAENGDQISLRYVPTWPNLGGFGYAVRTSPVVYIKGTPRGIDSWMNDYVRPLAQLTALGTYRVQPVSWVMAYAGDRGPGAQVFASDVAQDPFDADLTRLRDAIAPGHITLIRLGAGGADLAELFAKWHQLGQECPAFSEYLSQITWPGRSSKTALLQVVPALEALHVALHGEGPIADNAFKKDRRRIVKTLRRSVPRRDAASWHRRLKAWKGRGRHDLSATDVAFVSTWLSHRSSYPLHERLRTIASTNLSSDLKLQLEAKTQPIPPVLHGFVDGAKDVWDLMGTARNRLAHGHGKQPTDAQITALNQLAQVTAIGAALELLDVSDVALCAALESGSWRPL